MTRKKILFNLMLHYGVLFVFIIMFLIVLLILRNMEVSDKISVDILREHDNKIYCYLPIGDYEIERKEKLQISLSDGSCIIAKIVQIDTLQSCYISQIIVQSDRCNSHLINVEDGIIRGYVITKKNKLLDILFNKKSRKEIR